MTDRPRLTVNDIDMMPAETLPALALELAALQSRLAARLLAETPAAPQTPDRLLTIDEAAERLHTTKDWLRHRPTLPFVVKLSDGVVRYSEQGLARFIHRQTVGK
jgi:hypothetical protein